MFLRVGCFKAKSFAASGSCTHSGVVFIDREKPQTQRGPVLYLLVNAVFSSWLSKWGMPRLIPTSPLIRHLHDRRDRSGVLNRRASSSPGMCRHYLGGSVSEEIATLLIPLWRR